MGGQIASKFILHKFGSGLFQAFLYFNYVLVRSSESPSETQKAGPINSFFSASEDFGLEEVEDESCNSLYLKEPKLLWDKWDFCIIFLCNRGYTVGDYK